MKQFKKFCHIENGYNKELIIRIKQTIPEAIFVCQEKNTWYTKSVNHRS